MENLMISKRWIIFGIGASLFLMSQFYRASGAVIAPDLISDLKLSHHALGLLGAAFFYSFAIVQLPLGLFLDRVGPRITMTFLNLIGAAGAVIFAGADGMMGGVIGRALMGLGMAANLMGPLKLLTNWFDPRKFATLSGLFVSIGTLDSLAATTPLAMLVEGFGWRKSFYILAGLNAFLSVCLMIIVRDRPSDKRSVYKKNVPTSASKSIKTLFLSWNYWAISLTTFLRYGPYAAIQTLWAGPFLIEFLGLSPIIAGNLLFMLSIGLIFGGPFSGMLSDRILRTRKSTIITGLFICTVGTLAFSQWRSATHLILLGTILFAIGFFNSFGQVMYAHIKELMPDDMSGSAMTGINFFTMMGGGVFIHLLGNIVEHMGPSFRGALGGYQISFLICSVAFFLATILYFTTQDSYVSAEPKY